jgi:galactose oxidase-like protein/glyoxal oxidase-like protein/Big-like domain-containing protein/Kelch motif protein
MNKTLRYVRRSALLAVVAATILRCSGDNVQPPTPSAIAMLDGNGQTGAVGGALPAPLIVVVTDESGNPVEGVSVAWDAHGTGAVSSDTSTTGPDGHASVQRTLGSQAGEQMTTAAVSGLAGSPVTFVSIATDGQSPSLSVTTQPSSTAESGVPLAAQPVVQLKNPDGSNKAQSGVAVTASLASGTGTLDGTVTRQTNASGAAAFTDLTITGVAGSYTLRFAAAGVISAISSGITVSAPTGNSILLTTNPPTSALDGEVFDPAVQPVVQVKDGSGNPVAGIEVTASVASGGGTLEGATSATTDAQGVAKFGDLGISGPGSTTLAFTTGSISVTASPVNVTALPPEATTGKWGPLVPWPIVPLHIHLLPTGKVLGWGKYEDGGVMGTHGTIPRLWDPATGQFRGIAADTMLFCSGHTLMADGRLMVSGGHKADNTGIDVTNIFDPTTETWETGVPKMAFGRWYPTVTILPDGRLLTMAGRDSAAQVVKIPEIWEGNQWVQLPGASAVNIPYYPRNFVAPDGRIFMAGERVMSRWFDVDAFTNGMRGKWTNGPSHTLFPYNRDYGTAVMYEPGKIMYTGGGGNSTWPETPDPRTNQPTAIAEKIDLTAGSPSWTSAGTMAFRRRHLNSTILPDGTVLITGGTTGGGFVDINPGDAARAAEVWDPKTNQWHTLASNSVMRVYHSVSLLLPDGTVLHGASGNALSGGSNPVPVPDEANHEIFSPPYLFKGARPAIASAPATVSYGQIFTVSTPNAAQVTNVRWIRLGSVTHAFDMSQRANTLSFTRSDTGVNVTAPIKASLAPPGYYLLFILNRNGVPSVGKIVRVG